jgi:FkbM family methyltransferase
MGAEVGVAGVGVAAVEVVGVEVVRVKAIVTGMSAPRSLLHYARPLAEACRGSHVHVAGGTLEVPGSRAIRLSVVAGNIRIHRLMQAVVRPGDTVVDVGANIGYNAVFAAALVGPGGKVIAIEPAGDNLDVLQRNVAANHLTNIEVRPVAAGRVRETREFFLRGEISAVNSFYRDSVYAEVTGVVQVPVERLDDICDRAPRVVKIDVEGAELDVLGGMSRLLRTPGLILIVEWHPLLQEAAGHAGETLPQALLAEGFSLRAASHTRVSALSAADLPRLAAHLRRSGRPVELVAAR